MKIQPPHGCVAALYSNGSVICVLSASNYADREIETAIQDNECIENVTLTDPQDFTPDMERCFVTVHKVDEETEVDDYEELELAWLTMY